MIFQIKFIEDSDQHFYINDKPVTFEEYQSFMDKVFPKCTCHRTESVFAPANKAFNEELDRQFLELVDKVMAETPVKMSGIRKYPTNMVKMLWYKHTFTDKVNGVTSLVMDYNNFKNCIIEVSSEEKKEGMREILNIIKPAMEMYKPGTVGYTVLSFIKRKIEEKMKIT